MLYARVVVDVAARALNRYFTYSIPPELQDKVVPGSLVEVPFGPRKLAGFVVEDGCAEDFDEEKIRPIISVLNPVPFWGEELLALVAFMRRYYDCSWLDALTAAIPAPVLKKAKHALEKSRRIVKAKTVIIPSAPRYAGITPNVGQQEALRKISECAQTGKPLLLYGVTGSGKTEVYLRAVQEALNNGRQALVMVPELSLTPQAVSRYRGRLGNTVGVLHSGLSAPERRDYWWKMRLGELRVALGTRSAVFAPLDNLGIIVIDEEHETSYKQENIPRYHARQAAFKRATYNKCALVLGSATPSIESFYMAKTGHYQLAELRERPAGRELPNVQFVDMRKISGRRLLSPRLAEALRQRFADGQQTVLLLNRRGFSKYLQCSQCGYTAGCGQCSIALAWHKSDHCLRCHYCGHEEALPDVCPKCSSLNFKMGTPGTERLYDEVQELLPGARILRMDRDTTSRINAHETILKQFGEGDADVLIGTKMVAKGLDYPNVTLVGVVNADAELNIPDFRSAERCFQLLSQVAGRAGRGDVPGEVIMQAYGIEDSCFEAVRHHDYEALYNIEIAARKAALYPPFCRLVRVLMTDADAIKLKTEALALAASLVAKLPSECVVGPSPCPIERIRGMYRYHLLLKGANAQELIDLVHASPVYAKRKSSIILDPDPQSLT